MVQAGHAGLSRADEALVVPVHLGLLRFLAL